MGKPRSKRLRTHFTELSPCHLKGLPCLSPLDGQRAPQVSSASRLSAMWPAAKSHRWTKQKWALTTLLPHVTLQLHEVILRRGRVFYSLSSSWALPQTPEVEESELGLKAKKSNTFDLGHMCCIYYWTGPEHSRSIWFRTQAFLLPTQWFSFQKEEFQFFP